MDPSVGYEEDNMKEKDEEMGMMERSKERLREYVEITMDSISSLERQRKILRRIDQRKEKGENELWMIRRGVDRVIRRSKWDGRIVILFALILLLWFVYTLFVRK